MIGRRDLLIGGACLAAAGGSLALTARREVRLLQTSSIADVIPRSFGGWTSEDIGDPLALNAPGSLSAKLYNELIVRSYIHVEKGLGITALFAYGARQTDDLQLHRPEICYPAFGYALVRNEPVSVPLAPNVSIPARRLAAQAEGRHESIIYWSRMGEFLPQSAAEQRRDRVQIAMEGIVPDGLLIRMSMGGDIPQYDWPNIQAFARDLILAAKPEQRKVLIGSQRAEAIAGGVKSV
jgi:EpsI family protein